MTSNPSPSPETGLKEPKNAQSIISRIFWGVAILMVVILAVTLMFQFNIIGSQVASASGAPPVLQISGDTTAKLPEFGSVQVNQSVSRLANLRTIIPERPRQQPIEYKVESGDSVFGIAQKFNLEPETVLWANSETLNDDPHLISIDQDLIIPATNGVLYKWKEGDTLEDVANRFKVKPEAILSWAGNDLDWTNPIVEPGTYIMVPGGFRELVQWVVPTIPRGPAGVNSTIPGACDTSAGGAYGTGTFIWPSANHSISGNDYWSGHLAIDIAAYTSDPIYASDSGVVVYAGGISGGYGNMVMIDHGNGYQTLYAHLSSITTRCSASVYQGQVIGLAGSTGNSTGPHLHFEMRYYGGFVNPHYMLP